MGRPDFPRTIIEFQDRFATDAACLDYLAASRWPEGFICPGCEGCCAWVLERRHLWECSDCSLQISDEFWLGGYEGGLKGSRQHGKKALVGAAIEVRGAGSGRLRLGVAN